MSLINTEKLLRWLFANILGDFSHWIHPHFRHSRAEGSRRAAQQPQRPVSGLISTPDLCLAELPHWGEVPAAISDSAPVQPTPHTTASASVTRAKVKKPWRSGSPAVCLPLADKSHLSHPFLPNTEQYSAQGSYLNVDLTAQSKNRLVFL